MNVREVGWVILVKIILVKIQIVLLAGVTAQLELVDMS
jgi:hypothetical protein